MVVASIVGLIGVLGLVLMGLIVDQSYLLKGCALSVIIFIIIEVRRHWIQRTMDRSRKIRAGGGDKTDLEWLKK